ncbi:MAG: flagellar hook basal-body protein [Candidatus Margulisiibacteriota bacterium]
MTDPILSIGQSGLETTDERVKSLVNKMVNAETPGFKQSDVIVRSFPLELSAAQKKLQAEKPMVEGTFYSHIKGSLVRTGGLTDFALGSDGFFIVSCPWGEGYTRDGRFTVNSQGQLVSTVGNFPLLGQSGPISVPPDAAIEVSQNGEITLNGTPVDRIRVVNFENLQNLEPVNGSIFKNPASDLNPIEVDSPRIVQGYVESSNANIVDQMMELIVVNRLYNMDAKIVSTRDQMMNKALDMGKMQ